MQIEVLKYDFSIIKVPDMQNIDLKDDFVFVAKTDEELSVILKTSCVPLTTIARADGYAGMRIVGELDFSLIGILSKITSILAENKIPVIAVSSYNTDYIFVTRDKLELAIDKLKSSFLII